MVFRAVVFKLLVWCGVEGYVSGLQDTALLTFKKLCYCVAKFLTDFDICVSK